VEGSHHALVADDENEKRKQDSNDCYHGILARLTGLPRTKGAARCRTKIYIRPPAPLLDCDEEIIVIHPASADEEGERTFYRYHRGHKEGIKMLLVQRRQTPGKTGETL
jgi:hypothetical protein